MVSLQIILLMCLARQIFTQKLFNFGKKTIINQRFSSHTVIFCGSVIIHEEQQRDIPSILGRIFKNIENQTPNEISITDYYIPYNYETTDLEQLICSFGSNGISIVLNLLWGNVRDIPEFVQSRGIPYYEADISIFPFVQIVERYLMKQSAVDCVFIVTSEEEVDQLLFGMIGISNLRITVLNNLEGSNVEKLLKLRPNPSYYAVIASMEKMNEILSVALNFNFVKNPDKWNLVFRDWKDDNFRFHDSFKDAVKLIIDENFCCQWLRQARSCSCPSNFSVRTDTYF